MDRRVRRKWKQRWREERRRVGVSGREKGDEMRGTKVGVSEKKEEEQEQEQEQEKEREGEGEGEGEGEQKGTNRVPS
jgi:DNA-directed RNA polymerase specialized sigma24 family protein